VTFVGSTPVAKLVATRCQNNHKRVVALGGAKNHLVAAPDCNITVTAQDIVNSYSGCAGQRCMAASVLLTIGAQTSLIDKVVTLSKSITPGNRSGEMGPVIDQLSLDKIERYLAQAEQSGAKILVDGRKWKGMDGTHEGGWWIGPTVIMHTNKDDPAMKVIFLASPLTNRKKSLGQCCRFWRWIQRKKLLLLKMPRHSAMQWLFIRPPVLWRSGSLNGFQPGWWELILEFLFPGSHFRLAE
jgi:Aldehyde dehydrogenase family